MRAEKFFTEEEKLRIREAVIAAESKTSGEIVPMLVTASARYTEVELLGLIVGLFFGVVGEWLWGDPWESPYSNLLPVAGALIGFLLFRIPAVKRWLISANRTSQAVHSLALASFAEHGLHYTREHTGILILVSLLEHRVEVLADRGIHAKVETAAWEEVTKHITEGLKTKTACDAFCKAIERCGEILAAHFPRQPDDKDELPNDLVTR